MPLGYTRAPRVTGSNQESRTRRLSRSLTTGNNGTPMVFTLYSTEEQKIDASPVAANTAAQRPATRWFSTEYAANSAVDIGYWQNAGYISLKLMNTGAAYWGVSYSSMGTAGANAVLFMNSTGYMTGNATKFSFDAVNTLLKVTDNSTSIASRFSVIQLGTGDSAILWTAGAATCSAGVDNSDNDRWKLSMSNTLGTTDAMTVNTYPSVNFPTHASAQKFSIGGSAIAARDTLYVYSVNYTMNTNESARSLVLGMPRQVVNTNGSYFLWGGQLSVLGNSHTIANGITDSGWRIGFTAECYTEGADFAGTLAKQVGFQIRHGQGSASATGTITNAVGVHIQSYKLGGNITNEYAIFQENVIGAGANTKNLFSGWTRFAPYSSYWAPAAHVVDITVNDSVTNGQIRIYQGNASADASIQFTLSGGASSTYSIGIDNSDGDRWKLTAASTTRSATIFAANSTLINTTIDAKWEMGMSKAIATVSANTTLNTTHYTVLVNAATAGITITLPAVASNSGRVYTIKKIDSSANTVTIDGSGTEKIDGANTATLSAQWNSRTIHCDGSAWYVIASV